MPLREDLEFLTTGLLPTLERQVAEAIELVRSNVWAPILPLAVTLDTLETKLIASITATIDLATSVGTGAEPLIEQWMIDETAGWFTDADRFPTKVTTSIDNVADISGQVAAQLEESIKNFVREAFKESTTTERGLVDKVFTWIGKIIQPHAELVDALIDKVLDRPTSLADEANRLLRAHEQSFLERVQRRVLAVVDTSDRLQNKAIDFVKDRLTPLEVEVERLTEKGGIIPQALESLADVAIPGLSELLSSGLGVMNQTLETGFKSVLSSFFGDLSGDVVERIDGVLRMLEDDPDVATEIKSLTAPGFLPVGAVGGLLAGVALPMIISNLLQPVLHPFIMKLSQRVMAKVQPSILPMADLIQGVHRGVITPDRLIDHAKRGGWTEEDQQAMSAMLKVRPQTIELVDYWRRDLVDDTRFASELELLGWDEEWRAVIAKAAFPPPGVGDLITMAVREVFTPEIAESFGQFQDIPDAFIEHAKTVGLSEFWARNFWAAHWALPSTQQGFEMLHRAEIDEDKLDLLLRAQDVMPFWRGPLKAIAYRPFTRVDVRRMHAFGVLTPAQVRRAYQDIGFDEDKAQTMTDFTIAFNDRSSQSVSSPERDLTKSDIIGLLNDGLIDENETKTMLQGLGFDQDESQYLVGREIVQLMRSERKDDIAHVVEQAVSGNLSFSEAQDKLIVIDTTDNERTKALGAITRALDRKLRKPSKGDLDDWFERDLIDLTEYGVELRTLGFPDRYVALYQAEISAEDVERIEVAEERAARSAQPRTVSKAQLDRLLRSEIIDNDDYESGLDNLGFTPGAVANFLKAILEEIQARQEQEEKALSGDAEPPEHERRLTRPELDRFLLSGLITEAIYVAGLIRIGFAEETAALFLTLAQRKMSQNG